MHESRCERRPWRVTLVALAALASGVGPCVTSAQDVVWTIDERSAGRLTASDGSLAIDGRKIDAAKLVSASWGEAAGPAAAGLVELRDGQRWSADVLRIEMGRAALRSPIMGEMEIDRSRLASVALTPEFSPSAVRPGALLERNGRAIPGELMWMDEEQIGIDSPLGVINLPRSRAAGYRFAGSREAVARKGGAADEVRLTDGGVVRGKLAISPDHLKVSGSDNGELSFAWPAVRAIVGRSDRVTWLDLVGLEAERSDALGVLDAEPVARADRPGAVSAAMVRAGSTVRLRVGDGGKGRVRLRGWIERPDGMGGEAIMTIDAGGRRLARGRIDERFGGMPLSAEVAGGTELVIEVRHGDRIGLPAGAVICDLHVIGE